MFLMAGTSYSFYT